MLLIVKLFDWLRGERRTASYSISDPMLAVHLGIGVPSYAGVEVTEGSTMGLSGVYRAVSLIAGTLASLDLGAVETLPDGMREPVASWLDNPGGDLLTPFEWKETIFTHMLLHGDTFLAHLRNGGGGLAALVPIHPLAVAAEWAREDDPHPGGKIYRATMINGEIREFDGSNMTQVSGLSLDNLRGISVIGMARHSLGTAIAGDRAAAKMFSGGALINGMVTPDEDIEDTEVDTIKRNLDRKILGCENAGGMPFVNRKLKFTPWTMTSVDAQFLQSRQFSIEEIARWFGVPPYELMQTEKQTSWGTGIEAQQRGLARQVIGPWANRLEQRLSRLLPANKRAAFDFSSLERPTPEQEVDLLIKKLQAGIVTRDEARTQLNLSPLPPESAPAPIEGAPNV